MGNARVMSFVLLMLTALASAGCSELGSMNSPGKIGMGCESSSQCGYGEECVLSLCAPKLCTSESLCPEPLACCNNQCQGADESCSQACLTDDDCTNGICLATRCIGRCTENADCAVGETCIPYLNVCLPGLEAQDGDVDWPEDLDGFEWPEGDLPFDLPFDISIDGIEITTCGSDDDCDRGRCLAGMCVDLGGDDGQGCESAGDCAIGQYCVMSMCVGGSCTTSADCDGGYCVPFINQCAGGNPGNDLCEDDSDCGTGEQCIFGICINTGGTTDGDQDTTSERERERPDTASTNCEDDEDCEENQQCLFGYCISTNPQSQR